MCKNSFTRRFFALTLCLALLLPAAGVLSYADSTAYVAGDGVRVRTGPGTNYALVKDGAGNVISLSYGTVITVTGDKRAGEDGNAKSWYPIRFQYNGATYTGFFREDYVSFPTTPTQPVEPPAPNPDFETQLASFPESYRPYLTGLHNAHPSWNFEAVNTGLDWNYVQNQENVYRRSMTDSKNSYDRSKASGCYNAETDTYICLEGGSWYQAAPELVAYYMDPRNFLNETDIFQFERLSFDPALQTAAGVTINEALQIRAARPSTIPASRRPKPVTAKLPHFRIREPGIME